MSDVARILEGIAASVVLMLVAATLTGGWLPW